MQHEWYGNRDKSNVVVSLVSSTGTFSTSTKDGRRNFTNKKRKHNKDDEEQEKSVVDLHLHSNHLHRCSKYFDACLSERWSKVKTKGFKIKRFTLELHADVKYYKDCFSCMYSPWQKIYNIKFYSNLVRVASQITYQKLVEACICYLAAVSWSQANEKRIQNFAKSPYYPTDCAAGLSAWLKLPLSNTERYNEVLKLTKNVLYKHFLFDFTVVRDEDSRVGFSSVLHKIMKEDYHNGLLQGLLEDVNQEVESSLYNLESNLNKGAPIEYVTDFLDSTHWILTLLLKTGLGGELVGRFIIGRCVVSDMVAAEEVDMQMKWFKAILRMLQDVMVGQLLLAASLRLEKWS